MAQYWDYLRMRRHGAMPELETQVFSWLEDPLQLVFAVFAYIPHDVFEDLANRFWNAFDTLQGWALQFVEEAWKKWEDGDIAGAIKALYEAAQYDERANMYRRAITYMRILAEGSGEHGLAIRLRRLEKKKSSWKWTPLEKVMALFHR